MTISAISNIALAIGFTELLACIISRKLIFQSKSYTRAVADHEKATARRDKTQQGRQGTARGCQKGPVNG